MHTSNSFSQSQAPTKNFAPPSPLPEREKNKQLTRWAITVHQKSCSAKGKIARCNSYAYENLLPNYSREYFYKVKTKKKNTVQKTPSTIQRKILILFGCFAKFFTPCLHLISPQKKIPLYNTEKNSSFVDVFSKKIYKLFSRKKRFAPFIRQTSSFILFIHQKCKGSHRKTKRNHICMVFLAIFKLILVKWQ